MNRPFRLVSWNVEWFDRLFGAGDALMADGERSARYEVTRARQAGAIAGVLRHLDPDAVLVIEAPDEGPHRHTRAALEVFARWAGLRTGRATIGFANHTRQEIALMFDPAVVAPGSPLAIAPSGPSPRGTGTPGGPTIRSIARRRSSSAPPATNASPSRHPATSGGANGAMPSVSSSAANPCACRFG